MCLLCLYYVLEHHLPCLLGNSLIAEVVFVLLFVQPRRHETSRALAEMTSKILTYLQLTTNSIQVKVSAPTGSMPSALQVQLDRCAVRN